MALTIIMMIIGLGFIFTYRNIKEKRKEKENEKQTIENTSSCGGCPLKEKCNKSDKCQ
jgi:Tfp pilus assembly protein PilO